MKSYPTPTNPPLERPWIRANFATTPNGVVRIDGASKGVSGPPDREVFAFLRNQCDAVLVGASTARKENYSVPKNLGTSGKAPLLIIVTNSIDLDDSAQFLDKDSPPLIVTTEQSLSKHLSRIESISDKATVVTFGRESVDFRELLSYLRSQGIGLVLCEGGPQIFSQLLTEGLVDELCLTISPRIGPGEPSGIVNIGDSPQIEMSLASFFEVDGYLFCRYLAG